MCGLISAFYPEGVIPPSADDLKRGLEASLETINYRGPDSSGTYVSPDARCGAYISVDGYAYSFTFVIRVGTRQTFDNRPSDGSTTAIR
jgi:hypothetical protein